MTTRQTILIAILGIAIYHIPAFATNWQNQLTCDDGLRLDQNENGDKQIVLFGNAAQHFVDAGAFGVWRLNDVGEFVQQLVPSDSAFKLGAILHDGQLLVDSQWNRSNKHFSVTWRRYQNSPGTDYQFYHCH